MLLLGFLVQALMLMPGLERVVKVAEEDVKSRYFLFKFHNFNVYNTLKPNCYLLCRTRLAAAALASEAPVMDLDLPVDPNEPTYCLCNQVSYGEMVACDNPSVRI